MKMLRPSLTLINDHEDTSHLDAAISLYSEQLNLQVHTQPGPEAIKLFSCSNQPSTKFQLLIKSKIPTNKEVYCFKSLRCCIFIILLNVKMPTIFGILTLKAPMVTKFVWFSRLLKCLRSLYGKQCGTRSDCS